MHSFHILRYESLVNAIEDETLALEVMKMIEQTLTKNQPLWSAPDNCNDGLTQLQALLHQFKGTLPMLTTSEFNQTLQNETEYIKQHLAVSIRYPQLAEALEKLRLEIGIALTLNTQNNQL